MKHLQLHIVENTDYIEGIIKDASGPLTRFHLILYPYIDIDDKGVVVIFENLDDVYASDTPDIEFVRELLGYMTAMQPILLDESISMTETAWRICECLHCDNSRADVINAIDELVSQIKV